MRNYSSVSVERIISGNISDVPTDPNYSQISLDNLDGFPSYPYVLVLDPDTSKEEAVLVTSHAGGTSVNVTRAIENGASVKTHSVNGKARHMIVGSDLQEVQDHINSTEDVHGIADTAYLATINGTQEFTNKTLTSPKVNENVALTATSSELNVLDGIAATTAELNKLSGATITTAELNNLHGVTSSTAELNILDGVTATAAELNVLDGITASTAELNKLDGVTASTAELNILDGVTATAAELNKLDGVTATAAEINHLDGITSTVTELNLLHGLTRPGWDSDPGTPATNWNGTGTSFRAIEHLGVVSVHLYMIRQGSTISAPADGNITDSLVYTLDTNYRPTYAVSVIAGIAGTTGGEAIINTDGTVYLRSMFDEDSSIGVGESLRITATYVAV